MKNEKGFVITGILYSLLIMFSIIMMGLLIIAANRKLTFNRLGSSVMNNILNENGRYRYLQSNGSFSFWERFSSLSDIKESYPIYSITNYGIDNSSFNLFSTNTNINIIGRNSSLLFNGEDSYATSKSDLLLNGSSSYVTLNNTYPRNMTIELWAKAVDYTNEMVLFSLPNLSLIFKDNTVMINDNAFSSMTTLPSINDWHYYVLTFDSPSNAITLYVDGIERGSVSYTNPSGSTLYIGRSYDDVTNLWNGYVQDIRVWSYIRDNNEITNDMHQSYSSDEPNMIAYYPLKNNTNTIAKGIVGTNGSITDPIWLSNSNSNGLVFDGNTYLRSSYSYPSTLTVEAYAIGSSNASNINLLSFDNLNLVFNSNSILLNDNAFSLEESLPLIDEWHHYAVTLDEGSNTANLYIDGSFIGTTTYVSPLGDNLYIGGLTNSWQGSIRDVRVWNTIRTEYLINSNMNNLTASSSNLINHFPLTGHIYNTINNKITSVTGNISFDNKTYETIYYEFNSNACGKTLISFDYLDKNIGINNDCKLYIKSLDNITTADYTYKQNDKIKVILKYDGTKYDYYIGGVKYEGSTTTSHVDILSFNHLSLGYNEFDSSSYLNGNIYKVIFSDDTIRDEDAISITNNSLSTDIITNQLVKYDFTDYIQIK